MLPPSPVPGPIGEDGFVLPLFESSQPVLISPDVDLSQSTDISKPSADLKRELDNNCACE